MASFGLLTFHHDGKVLLIELEILRLSKNFKSIDLTLLESNK